MDIALFIACLISITICGSIGYFIGDSKGMNGFGLLLGVLLGPVGLIILALLPKAEGATPQHEMVYVPPAQRAVAYKPMKDETRDEVASVADVMAARGSPRPTAPRFFICNVGGDVEGPYSNAEIAQLRDGGAVTDETLFCLEGSQEWSKLSLR